MPPFDFSVHFDRAQWEKLPDDGVPEGLVYRDLEEDEAEDADDQQPIDPQAAMDVDAEEAPNKPQTQYGGKKVNAALLVE